MDCSNLMEEQTETLFAQADRQRRFLEKLVERMKAVELPGTDRVWRATWDG
jgi:hypothetical protein